MDRKDVKVENDMENSLLSMRLCRDYPGRLAIVGNGQSCTYEEMHRGILGLEKRLRAMGVKQGSRVALWSYNSANWLIAFFAIVRAGGTAVLVNYSMSSQDSAGLLTMTETGLPALRRQRRDEKGSWCHGKSGCPCGHPGKPLHGHPALRDERGSRFPR